MFKIKYLLGQSTKGAEKDKDKSKHKDTKMGENISWLINNGGVGAEINF